MSMRESLIGRVPLFSSLPPGELEALGTSLREASFAQGSLLFSEGDYGDLFYIVLEGQIEIIKALGTADERLIDVHGPGEFVGEMSLINRDGLRTASVRASHDVRMVELTRAEFDTLLRRHPAMVYELLQVISDRLRASHDVAIRDLHEKNERLAQAYAELQAAQAQIIEQETLMRELQLARELQESMLPAKLPQLEGFDIGARMLPAHIVGGDFYDVIELGPDDLGVAIGDASGKGMPAALYMALASSLLRAEVSRGAPPEEALGVLNRHLLARNSKGMFVTLVYGQLRRAAREFHYVRAGHEYPLVWDARGDPIPVVRGGAHPLGMFPGSLLDVQSVPLPPGATLLLFSDGASDAMDERGSPFERRRLLDAARATRGGTAQDLCDRLVESIVAHQGAAAQADDITLVAVRALD